MSHLVGTSKTGCTSRKTRKDEKLNTLVSLREFCDPCWPVRKEVQGIEVYSRTLVLELTLLKAKCYAMRVSPLDSKVIELGKELIKCLKHLPSIGNSLHHERSVRLILYQLHPNWIDHLNLPLLHSDSRSGTLNNHF